MCNLSQGVYDRGKAEGWAKGKNEGLAEGISIGRTEGIGIGRAEGIGIGRTEGSLKGKEEAQINILKRLLKDSVTLDKALEIVDIDVETYKKYLNENIK
jgi:flagellar biosynthesis/type III secretory pathway protein FliH